MPPIDLDARPHGEKERRASQTDRDGDEGHLIRRHAGAGEAAADRERDRPVEVPRHEPFLVLDQAPKKMLLRAPPILRGHDGDSRRCRSLGERAQILHVDDRVPREPHGAGRGRGDERRAGAVEGRRERRRGRDHFDPGESGPTGGQNGAAREGQAEERRLRGDARAGRRSDEGETRARRHRLEPGRIARSADIGSPPRRSDSFARARTLAQSAASARLWPRSRGLIASPRNSAMTPPNQSG